MAGFPSRSDAVATCYDAPRPDDLLGGGIYLTRDVGFIDPAGNLHLTGTTGGAINVAGRKVSPAKVEAAILATGLGPAGQGVRHSQQRSGAFRGNRRRGGNPARDHAR